MYRPILLAVLLAATLATATDPKDIRATPLVAVTYPPGWNLVGAPAGTTLVGVSGSLYTLQFKDGGYESLPVSTALTGGLGYWAYFPDGGGVQLAGSSPCVIAVPIGAGEWVMVGNPSPTSAATVRSADRVYSYGPASGYTAVTSGMTVAPGQGAWAFASVNTTVAVVVDGCPGSDSVPPSPPVKP